MAYPQTTFFNTQLDPGSIIARRRDVVSSNTLFYQLEVLKKTGRYDAFKLQWHASYDDKPDVWPVPNHLFWDSDIAKWLEGACYILQQEKDATIESAVHELVAMIKSAQQPDGYINIHYTVVEPGKRFTNLRDFHELYNAGHLIEAALAHEAVFRNKALLGPILSYVDLLCKVFGDRENQIPGYPGHPEIELALLRLFYKTKDQKHLNLARYFILERGNPEGWDKRHYFDVEADRRGDDPNKRPMYYPESRCLWYYSAHRPLLEQRTIEGHSVRAMYLLAAAADLVRIDHDAQLNSLKSAVDALWKNMVTRKMYVTGGIGAMKKWEGFGLDYFLPQGSDEGGCYSETCAAIGVMMLAERRLQTELRGSTADIMETVLYNTVLTAMSHDGRKFTYVNQLASSSQNLSKREEWFTCACCPPNVLRILAQIGGYIWSYQADDIASSTWINVHLFIGSKLRFQVRGESVQLTQTTQWPWDGEMKFRLDTKLKNISIRLRIPGWAKLWRISPEPPQIQIKAGYLELPAAWLASNSIFTLHVSLQPRLLSSHPYTNQNTLTIARGPIIYCAEDIDNPWVEDHFKSLQLDPDCAFEENLVNDIVSGDTYVAVTVSAGASILDIELVDEASPAMPAPSLRSITRAGKILPKLYLIPYFARANRGGKGHMRVGFRRWER